MIEHELNVIKSIREGIFPLTDGQCDYTIDSPVVTDHRSVGNFCSYEIPVVFPKCFRKVAVVLVDYGNSYLISVYIMNLHDNNNQMFSVNQYLNSVDPSAINRFALFSCEVGSDLTLRIQHYLSHILRTDHQTIAKIIRGESWLSLPFDWHEYK